MTHLKTRGLVPTHYVFIAFSLDLLKMSITKAQFSSST